MNVGLDYLALSRSSKSLSGGEAQRIRLATQIGSQLVGVLYILDEPSIGLHQRDNERLIKSLESLRDIGNSVIVVEHDKEMIEAADFVVDIGPGAGKHGGQIINATTVDKMLATDSLTTQYLKGIKKIELPKERRKGNGKTLEVLGATGHNLQKVNLKIPLGTFTCVTGVSGSGKSSLINQTLYPILLAEIYNGVKKPLPYKAVKGLEHLDKVIEIDQTPIGRTPRSNPATYTKVFDEIRTLFSGLQEAQIRGYKPGRFSFNVAGGRCETCKGGGMKLVEMNFLPDVYVACEVCHGARYNRETLQVLYKGKNIADVLEMPIAEAAEFFAPISSTPSSMTLPVTVAVPGSNPIAARNETDFPEPDSPTTPRISPAAMSTSTPRTGSQGLLRQGQLCHDRGPETPRCRRVPFGRHPLTPQIKEFMCRAA